MRFFELTLNSNDWRRYQIEGSHEWSLPALICETCGSRWVAIGEAYPAVVRANVEECFREGSEKAVGNEELDRWRACVRPHVPAAAPLHPGAAFGQFRGRLNGRPLDFAWNESWTMFCHEEVVLRLHELGVRLPPCGTPQLLGKGKTDVPALLEPQAVPVLDFAREGLERPDRERCRRCGRESSGFRRFLVPADAYQETEWDIFRARNCPTVYVVTERFVDAVAQLGLSGCVTRELEVI